MLYPQSHQPMTPELFAHPGSEYRGAPFWAWNGSLSREDLLWQLEQLKKMGFGGAHIHVRTGLENEYLGEEFFSLIRACVEKARQEHMLIWLYDEDRWPSGAAGGLVTKDPAFRQRYALFTRARREGETPLAVFDVSLNPDGSLRAYRRIADSDAVSGFALYVYVELAENDPWYNNQSYVNTLDPAAIARFLQVTHDAYAREVGGDFGGIIPAVFTDEPQFSRKQTLAFADDPRDVTLPWTDDLPATFREAYGEDLLAGLPELLWDLPEGRTSLLRYHFHDHIAERFARAFADQCGQWCADHGIMLTGHMMEEPTLQSQTAALGEAMRSYRSFQLPGIDMLCDWREYTTAKQAQSASRQFGREGVLSELYGVTNWNFDFRGHKLAGDWQAALGVTVRVPHLSWVSMKGEAKRDYPATFNYQTPWYQEYGYVEDHFARLNTALTRGRALSRLGVIHPVESYWLHWGARENTEAVRAQMDERFRSLTEWLLRGLVDFDFISESLLPDQCPADFEGPGFPVGEMCYEALLVPPVETLRATTLTRLRRFVDLGGRVLVLGDAPALLDAKPSPLPAELYARCEPCSFDRLAILDRLEPLRDLEIRDQTGARVEDLLYQLRREGEERWLFVCHADRCVNPDVPAPRRLRLRLRGRWDLTLYDTLTGGITPLPTAFAQGWTLWETPFYDQDSLLLRLTPAAESGALKAEAAVSDAASALRQAIAGAPDPRLAVSPVDGPQPDPVCRFLSPLAYTLSEPNVLLLDRPEYALDEDPWQPAEEILRLDNLLRDQLSWPRRGGSIAQPWVETDHSTPHTLRLRFIFPSEIRVDGVELALENAADCAVTLNGVPAGPVSGWYVDKAIGRRPLSPVVPGKNVLEVSMPYGRRSNPEAMFLLGAFGVRVQGIFCTLTALPEALTFGDFTRQGLPFYGGNLTYHLTADLAPGRYALQASDYRSALLRVTVDGRDQGPLAFSPSLVSFEVSGEGPHTIDIKAFGCRINTFGQVHQADKTITWWGPDSWRTRGVMWTDEYSLWPQGILKSPIIYKC